MSEAPEPQGGFRLWMLLPALGAAAVLAVFLLGLGREDGGRNLPPRRSSASRRRSSSCRRSGPASRVSRPPT